MDAPCAAHGGPARRRYGISRGRRAQPQVLRCAGCLRGRRRAAGGALLPHPARWRGPPHLLDGPPPADRDLAVSLRLQPLLRVAARPDDQADEVVARVFIDRDVDLIGQPCVCVGGGCGWVGGWWGGGCGACMCCTPHLRRGHAAPPTCGAATLHPPPARAVVRGRAVVGVCPDDVLHHREAPLTQLVARAAGAGVERVEAHAR